MRSALACVLYLARMDAAWAGSEPNPPTWPSSVSVFDASTPAANITAKVNAVYNHNGGRKDNGQFSPDRYALMFMPGTYDVDVPVGYYTQVLGLGESPTDVVFTGDRGVYSEEGDYDIDIGALDSFWRGAFAHSVARDLSVRSRRCWFSVSPSRCLAVSLPRCLVPSEPSDVS